MKALFLDAPYAGEVQLSSDTLRYFQKQHIKTVALYASVQFVHLLEKVKQQLDEAGIPWLTSKARRTHVEGQLLGCDNDEEALNLPKDELQKIDAFLYIGDGRFHPLALVFAQKELQEKKPIICNDPMSKMMRLVSQKDVALIMKKYKSSLMKFLNARNVGVLVTIKPGQQQFRPALALEKKYPDKKFYYFIDNVISFDQLENFPFIETWVNTACPRIGWDDQEKFLKGVINIRDALKVEEVLERC